MTHNQIVNRFLSPKLSDIVAKIESEWLGYNDPSTVAKPGCLRRDRLRALLTSRAYNRYAKTL